MKIIEDSLNLSREINKSLEGVTLDVGDNYLFPSLFHSLVIEHHRSIIVLCENKLFSSAASLIRCIFESYVKGVWFSEFAKVNDFEKLRKDEFNKDFYKLVNAIEAKHNNGLFLAKERYWPNLNSLTHSGLAQLSRRLKGDEITSNFDDSFIEQMLSFSNTYALLSCGKIIEMSDDLDAKKAYIDMLDKHDLLKDTTSCVNGL